MHVYAYEYIFEYMYVCMRPGRCACGHAAFPCGPLNPTTVSACGHALVTRWCVWGRKRGHTIGGVCVGETWPVRLRARCFSLRDRSRRSTVCASGTIHNLWVLRVSKSHDGKGANGSKNRPHDAFSARCRVPSDYEPCSERVLVCQLR